MARSWRTPREGASHQGFPILFCGRSTAEVFRLPVPVSPVIFGVINALNIDVVHSHTPLLMSSLQMGGQ